MVCRFGYHWIKRKAKKCKELYMFLHHGAGNPTQHMGKRAFVSYGLSSDRSLVSGQPAGLLLSPFPFSFAVSAFAKLSIPSLSFAISLSLYKHIARVVLLLLPPGQARDEGAALQKLTFVVSLNSPVAFQAKG